MLVMEVSEAEAVNQHLLLWTEIWTLQEISSTQPSSTYWFSCSGHLRPPPPGPARSVSPWRCLVCLGGSSAHFSPGRGSCLDNIFTRARAPVRLSQTCSGNGTSRLRLRTWQTAINSFNTSFWTGYSDERRRIKLRKTILKMLGAP